jgi:hypothetical protein
MDLSQYAIGGVSILFIIFGIVEAAKRYGVRGKASETLAYCLGAFFVSLVVAISKGMIPEVALPWIELVVVAIGGGLTIGLTATGLYDLVDRTGIFDRSDDA